jgi:folate-binding protein YgfZ
MMYKLRARADIRDASADYSVAAFWGDAHEPQGSDGAPLWFADPRLPALGYRELVTLRSDWALGGEDAKSATQDEYHAHRIAHGIPEGGKDYAFGDAFPHEALFDQLNGVSFTKGCYVGQEVVSRMENRGTARKRVVPVVAERPLPASGTPVTAGGVELGKLGSVAGNRGLALLRLDRVAEFEEKGEGLQTGEVAVRVELPTWAHFQTSAPA